MANIQNDIFENQEIAYGFGTYNVTKQGDVKCASLTVNGEPIVPGGGSSFKGIVANESQLPATAENGDIYLVKQTVSTVFDFDEQILAEYDADSATYNFVEQDIYDYCSDPKFRFVKDDVVEFEITLSNVSENAYSKSLSIKLTTEDESENFGIKRIKYIQIPSQNDEIIIRDSFKISKLPTVDNLKLKIEIDAEIGEDENPVEPEYTDFTENISIEYMFMSINRVGIKKLVMFADGEYLQIA